jgi:hypothetical protein
MDEWRTQLVAQLLGDARGNDRAGADASRDLAASTAMEIALGKARSELTYVLELGRAHHLPIVGNVVGDEVWIRLGEARLAFRFDRSALRMVASVVGRGEAWLAYDAKMRAVVIDGGAPVDVDRFVREAIDATVRAWKSPPMLSAGSADQTIEMTSIPEPHEDEPKE